MSHRRRGVGVGRSGANKYTQKKADELKAISLQSALDTVEQLEIKLADFAKKHQQEIQTDPVFRQRFLEMCAPLGVDPLLASKKSIWGQLMGGMGDYYYQLAVKVAEVCLSSRSKNGGIMSMAECQAVLVQRKTRFAAADVQNVSAADIQVAIQKLAKLGGGFRTIQVGNTTMIVSVPTELDNDHMQIMTLASFERTGVTMTQVRDATGWSKERTERALELLLQQGMAWLDTYHGEDYYWFPSVWQEIKNDETGNIQ